MSNDNLFTDSFAPRDDAPRDTDQSAEESPAAEDELDEVEDLLPKGEPTEGTAPLP